MFPKFTEYIANEQHQSRLEEAERNRLVRAFQQQKSLMAVKQPLIIRVVTFLLNLI